MSRIFSYSKTISAIGSLDGYVTLQQNVYLNPQRPHYIRVLAATISTSFPNIYNYNGFNNGLIRLSNDNWATHTDIQLDNGIYTASQIQSAVNSTIASWYTDSTDQAFKLQTNTALRKCYIILDSSKLVAPFTQICVDFGQSYLWQLLGFSATKTFHVDGTYEADLYPMFDWFGNRVAIRLNGIAPYFSVRNGTSSTEICSIQLQALSSASQNIYEFPMYSKSPKIIIDCSTNISTYNISFVGERSDLPMVFLEGSCYLLFEIVEF